MKASSLIRTSLLAPVALALAACGGGIGGDEDYVPVSPVRGVSTADIENRTGITKRVPKVAPNSVALINNVKGLAKARIVVRDSQSLDDGTHVDPAIYMQLDQNGDGIYDGQEDYTTDEILFNPDGNPISGQTNEPIVSTKTLTYGGADMVAASHIVEPQSHSIVYVPANSKSDMYGGMFVNEHSSIVDASGMIATWGRNTSADDFANVRDTELNTQDGRATYHGVAEAVVSGGNIYEAGRYQDLNATGEVDFSNSKITTSATLTGMQEQGQTIGVKTAMTYTANGTINQGAAVVTGLGTGPAAGVAKGEFYGSQADTLGVVFTGNRTESSSTVMDTKVIGGMLLNRTDD